MNLHGKVLFKNYNEVRAGLWQGENETELHKYERHMGEIYKRYYKKYFCSYKNMKILEIGCSTGGMLQALYKDGFRNLTGIDMCESNIQIARKRNRSIQYIIGDGIEFLKNSSEKYDIIYCRAVLEHMDKEDVMEAIWEMKRHCSDRGGVLIDVPNMDWIWATHERYMDFTHECGFTEESLIEILKPHFKSIQISYEDTSYNTNMRRRIARYILWKLYHDGGIGISYERMWAQDIVVFASESSLKIR